MFKFLKIPQNKPLRTDTYVDKDYKKMRWQVFIGIFVGYAGYYLVRKNFDLAKPNLIDAGIPIESLGWIGIAFPITYGFSKFFMGNISDRSDARKFMSLGLFLSGIIMIILGFLPIATSSIYVMAFLLLLNGWFQGMGWPPSGRVMVNWFSVSERGSKISLWNIAHNVGGSLLPYVAAFGVFLFSDWHAKFYFNGFIAIIIAIFIYLTVKDTPKSQGLPNIEDYRDDHSNLYSKEEQNKVYSSKEIFIKYVLKNKLLWFLAFANAFIYLIRYGILDWAPTYLQKVKGYSEASTNLSYSLFELAGIPGTLIAGYISDKWFKSRRAPVSFIYMILVIIAIFIYWQNPVGNIWIDKVSISAIGFLIYGPIMLIGLQALDIVPKNAAGTAAGFTGLFGYVVGAVAASALIGIVVGSDNDWASGFMLLIGAGIISIIFIIFTWFIENKHHKLSINE